MPLYHYSSDTLSPGINADFHKKSVPVKIYAKILPATTTGKRFVYVRDQQKIATFIEDDLVTSGLIARGDNLAQPVAFTPQCGNRPARVTIVGMLRISILNSPNYDTNTDVTLIHSGTTKNVGTATVRGNVGGSTSWGQNVYKAIDNQVGWLKRTLEEASPLLNNITFIEYNGVKYGRGYRSFPRYS